MKLIGNDNYIAGGVIKGSSKKTIMKHKVKDLVKDGNKWTCVLESWNNCYCNATKKEVVIHQEKRPTKLDIINSSFYQ